MVGIISSRYADMVEISDALFNKARGMAQHLNQYLHNGLNHLPDRMHRARYLPPASLDNQCVVSILYAGHARESLGMSAERMVIPDGRYTVGQLLCSLYKRGDRWVEELDDSHLVCTVNGHEAKLFDTIEAGAEVRISS